MALLESMLNSMNIGFLTHVGLDVLIFIVVVAVVTFVCQWRIFVKMGANGLASIIPYYCNWVLCEKVWGNALISLAIILPGVIGTLIGGVISIPCFLAALVVFDITNWKKYRKFGKSTFFCFVGLWLPFITDMICAFDSAEFDS